MGWRYLGVVFLLIAGLVYLIYTSLLTVSSDHQRRLKKIFGVSCLFYTKIWSFIYGVNLLFTMAV
jgi:hypothetical protein